MLNSYKKLILVFILIFLVFFTFKNQAQTVSDIDGNIYNTVTIGNQIWLKENLKVTHYNNGDEIPNITDNTEWGNLTIGASCNYNNDENISDIYGKLYNWYSVNDERNICPNGWFVPSVDDWNALSNYLGTNAGGKLKETGTSHWNSPNAGATNSTGFSAFGAGDRSNYTGIYDWQKYFAVFWSSSDNMDISAPKRILSASDSNLSLDNGNKASGCSVRCFKNVTNDINENQNFEQIKIYPNPVRNKIYFDYADKQITNIKIRNLFGEIIISKENSDNINEIDVNILKSGIYIFEFSGDNWNIQRKFIKQ